jgi:hypothetical protein
MATQIHPTVRKTHDTAKAANMSEIPPRSICRSNPGCRLSAAAPFVTPKAPVQNAANMPAKVSGRMYDNWRSLGRMANQIPAKVGVKEISNPSIAA